MVIGIGSPYGDDQVGWRVAECVRQLPQAAGIEVLMRDRPGNRLLEDLEGCASAILVDAIHSDAPAGTLHCLTIDSLTEVSSITSSHGFGLAETLSLGKALGLLPSWLLIYGVEIEPGQATLLEAPLTPAVAAAVQRLARLLAQPDVLEGRPAPPA